MTGLMLIGSLALAAEPVPLLEAEDLCYGTLPDSTGCEVLLTLQDPLSDEELATACEDLDNLVVSCVDQLGETDTCWRIDDVLLDTCGGVDTHASWWRGDDDDDDGGGDWWRDDDDDDGWRRDDDDDDGWRDDRWRDDDDDDGRWRDDDDDDGGGDWWRDDDDDDGGRHW